MKSQTVLLRDREVAETLAVSRSTIRKQRFDRRRGAPHWFTLDPIMIGSVPRYRASDVEAWLASQPAQAKGR
jgi:predicted DNA-binding transcriptional regulator AlpA